MDYEYVGVPTQLYRGHGVERSSIYPPRGRTYDEIKPLNAIPKVENGIPTGLPTGQWYVAGSLGRGTTCLGPTSDKVRNRVMPPKRKSKPLKVAAEWAPGPRTSAWDALWRRILADVIDPGKNVPGDAAGKPRNEN